QVGLAPSELPAYHNHDDYILRATPGLYPDPLHPLQHGESFYVPPQQWRALWISIDLPTSTQPGDYPIEITFENDQGETIGKESFQLEVIHATLPEQRLIFTEWFHTDCLATY